MARSSSSICSLSSEIAVMNRSSFITRIVATVLAVSLCLPSVAWAESCCCVQELKSEDGCPRCQSADTSRPTNCCQSAKSRSAAKPAEKQSCAKSACDCHSKQNALIAQFTNSLSNRRISIQLSSQQASNGRLVLSSAGRVNRVRLLECPPKLAGSVQVTLCCWLA